MPSLRLSLLLGALLLSAGCVNFRQAAPEKHAFVLDAPRPGAPAAPALAGRLAVRKFAITPRFDRAELVYRRSAFEYAADFYNGFFVPPDALITEETRRWMAASGLFQTVLEDGSFLMPDLALEGVISRFYGDFRPGQPARAVLEIELALVDVRSNPTRVLMHGRYSQEPALEDATATALAAGLSAALGQALGRFEEDARAQLKP